MAIEIIQIGVSLAFVDTYRQPNIPAEVEWKRADDLSDESRTVYTAGEGGYMQVKTVYRVANGKKVALVKDYSQIGLQLHLSSLDVLRGDTVLGSLRIRLLPGTKLDQPLLGFFSGLDGDTRYVGYGYGRSAEVVENAIVYPLRDPSIHPDLKSISPRVINWILKALSSQTQ